MRNHILQNTDDENKDELKIGIQENNGITNSYKIYTILQIYISVYVCI